MTEVPPRRCPDCPPGRCPGYFEGCPDCPPGRCPSYFKKWGRDSTTQSFNPGRVTTPPDPFPARNDDPWTDAYREIVELLRVRPFEAWGQAIRLLNRRDGHQQVTHATSFRDAAEVTDSNAGSDTSEGVVLIDAVFRRETQGAVLVRAKVCSEGIDVWLPKKLVTLTDDYWRSPEKATQIHMPAWLAEQKGLVLRRKQDD